MVKIYLLLNSFLYLLLSALCLLKPGISANFLGYSFLNNSGKVEYATIYIGLEFGFALFLGISAFYLNMALAGLIFCVCIYSGAMITRTSFALYYGNISKVTYMVGGLEYILGICGIILLLRELKEF